MPEAVQALGDAGGVVLAMVAGPRVHAGVARALPELQSELRGATKKGAGTAGPSQFVPPRESACDSQKN